MPQAPGGELCLRARLLLCCALPPCLFSIVLLRSQAALHPSAPVPALNAKQGVQDTVLEQELPNLSVNDRALAINALLSALKLQARGGGRATSGMLASVGFLSKLFIETFLATIAYSEDVPSDKSLQKSCTWCILALQILVNPADPSSHIYKASAPADTAR